MPPCNSTGRPQIQPMNDASVHVACHHCGAVNRVPAARLADGPTCGRCGTAVLPGEPVELSDANFDAVVGKTELPVVVDFWAPWCGPCRMMAPAFEEVAQRMEPRARFAKLNTDEAQETAARYGIRSIPTLIVFRGGREVARQSGAAGVEQLTRWISDATR